MYFKPKKRLGQNFLVDRNIQRKIINSLKLNKHDIVIEIGPGRGELTEYLLGSSKHLYAIELDTRLCELLRNKFEGSDNLTIINGDILKIDLKKLFRKTGKKVKVVGNIPYYISSLILKRLFEFKAYISSICLTLQREFGLRIVAKKGTKEYSSFSCFVQYHSQPRIIFPIKRNSFFPSPNVDSCFICLEPVKTCAFKNNSPQEKLLFRLIRSSFGKRRKMLKNGLKGVLPGRKLDEFFYKYGLKTSSRPEELSLQDFINLVKLQNN